MVDADIAPFFDYFVIFFRETASNFAEKIRYSIELFKYGYLQHFKHLYDPECQNNLVFTKLSLFNRQFWIDIIKSN